MGVMSCHRKKCKSVMVETYVSDIGYVCRECQEEFKAWLKNKDLSPNVEGEIRALLEEFMKTDREYLLDREISVDDFFEEWSS